MRPRPVLGITCCLRDLAGIPTQTVVSRYVEAASRYADVVPLLIPALPRAFEAAEIAERIDGLLLTGSPSNVDPSLYGDPTGGSGPFDPARDATTLPLINAVIDKGRPVFGICRGHQELNVALGGTLQRDLVAHHAPSDVPHNAMFDHLHDVALEHDGLLRRTFGRERLLVNSVHYQAIARLAPVLKPEARSADGIVEAVSARLNGATVLAVQWHPEWDADINGDSRTLLALFGRILRGETPGT